VRHPAYPAIAALLALFVLPLAACDIVESPAQSRGMHIDADQLKQLVPGTAMRADATAILGSPTAHASFDDNTWIYIGEVTRPRIGRIQGVESQNVVVLKFDQGGVLRSVQRLNAADGQAVEMVDRTTPSPGSEASFMQQLLGNVGRYSPGGALGAGGSQVGNTGGGLQLH
jgi:outer membrane protein assembly factor BamE (lipoprotein component of BamABCDE complex)